MFTYDDQQKILEMSAKFSLLAEASFLLHPLNYQARGKETSALGSSQRSLFLAPVSSANTKEKRPLLAGKAKLQPYWNCNRRVSISSDYASTFAMHSQAGGAGGYS